LEDFSTITQKNPRAEITYKKYRKQIDWRRNKVHELLIRGYSQYEISNTLHISQPTISRDIDFIRNQTTSAARRKDLPHRMYYEQQITLDSVGELMKNLWSIIDNPKIEVKERMKAMNLMLQCHNMRARLIGSGTFVKEFFDYADKVKSDEEDNTIREQEVSRREKSLERELEDHLKNEKLTQEKIWEIRDPNAVF
jgi:predicted transcriptional regulator